MSARYTSAALSRRLRDAGLERLAGGATYDYVGDRARTLRLDEVLEELTREREGGPLVGVDGLSVNYCPGFSPCGAWEIMINDYPVAYDDSVVEAAGLVLAQLLEARRG